MNWGFAPERRPGKLATTVGDHLVNVHIELRAAASHPHVQWKHLLMTAGEDLVTGLHNKPVLQVVKPFTRMVCIGRGFLQCGVGRNHFARDQIFADAEMLERTLRLSAPELVRRNIHLTQAVRFLAYALQVALRRNRVRTHSSSLSAHAALSILSPYRLIDWMVSFPGVNCRLPSRGR